MHVVACWVFGFLGLVDERLNFCFSFFLFVLYFLGSQTKKKRSSGDVLLRLFISLSDFFSNLMLSGICCIK